MRCTSLSHCSAVEGREGIMLPTLRTENGITCTVQISNAAYPLITCCMTSYIQDEICIISKKNYQIIDDDNN